MVLILDGYLEYVAHAKNYIIYRLFTMKKSFAVNLKSDGVFFLPFFTNRGVGGWGVQYVYLIFIKNF